MTLEDEYRHAQAKACEKCNIHFDGIKVYKVRDHCHLTGKFRSSLCGVCNLKLRQSRRMLPVVFHNLKGYDAHHICKQAIGEMRDWKLSVILQRRK